MKKKYTQKQWQMRHMLNDVVKWFGDNPEKRRCRGTNGCKYTPLLEKPESIGCAIGMYLDKKTQKSFDKRPNSSIQRIYSKNKEKLPQWMQEMPVNFLQDIQDLHDMSCNWGNWGNRGLSETGKETVKSIIATYNLPKTIYG